MRAIHGAAGSISTRSAPTTTCRCRTTCVWRGNKKARALIIAADVHSTLRGEALITLSRRLLISDAIHFDLAVDHHRRNDTGAPRRIVTEEFAEPLVERREVARVVEPHAAAHDMLRAVAGFLQNREHVLNRLMRLLDDAAVD